MSATGFVSIVGLELKLVAQTRWADVQGRRNGPLEDWRQPPATCSSGTGESALPIEALFSVCTVPRT
jgi:hypothetical protein